MENEELEIERQVDNLLMSTVLDSTLPPGERCKPGQFIKKYKKYFSLIDKMKAKHFNHERFVRNSKNSK